MIKNVGCPADLGSYNGACYQFSTSKEYWQDARAECKKLGDRYDLVVIDDLAENEHLRSYLTKAQDKHHHWIGLKENGTKNYFSWVNDKFLEYGNEFKKDPWGEDEPDEVSLIWNDSIESNFTIIGLV